MNKRSAGRLKPPARVRHPRRALLAGVAGALLAGCSTVDDRSATWEYLSPALFQPNCATVSCHSPAAAVSGLDFSDPARGYKSLTGLHVSIGLPAGSSAQGCAPMDTTSACQGYLRQLVTPFNPGQSRLVNMLRARDAPRMPPDRPLSEADIRLVERWIASGAQRTAGGNPTDGGRAPDGGSADLVALDGDRRETNDAAGDVPEGGGGGNVDGSGADIEAQDGAIER